MAAARGKRSQKHHFLWVSEVTLGIFGVQFWGFSVLQRHGVSPPGGDFFPWCFPIWGPDVKVAKIHGSSKRKKEPKASFSEGFRSHVRHFRGTILGLLRPSEPWCFAAGSCFFRSLTGIRSSSRRHQSCEQPQATESLDNLSLDNLSRQSTNAFFLGFQTTR